MALYNDNCIKIWNAKNFQCLLCIQKANKKGYLYSACFLKDSNQIYIVTSNMSYFDSEPIKIYDINGNLKKEIINSKDKTFFIDIFYDDNISLKKYIIKPKIYSISLISQFKFKILTFLTTTYFLFFLVN